MSCEQTRRARHICILILSHEVRHGKPQGQHGFIDRADMDASRPGRGHKQRVNVWLLVNTLFHSLRKKYVAWYSVKMEQQEEKKRSRI